MRNVILAAILTSATLPATAQGPDDGRVASSTVGEVGQRQGRPAAGEPLLRVDARIQNRIQSRIRNRIDRYYEPQANAVSPFAVADEEARAAGQRKRR